jgi:hypothetical protein
MIKSVAIYAIFMMHLKMPRQLQQESHERIGALPLNSDHAAVHLPLPHIR